MKLEFNLPLFLTLIRLVLAPILLPVLIVGCLSQHIFMLNCGVTFIIFLLSLTDFFDGYLARKFKQETFLGALLDPIADKFLLYSTLLGLLVAQQIWLPWVIVLIGREFFMMGLRLVASEAGISIPVSLFGKTKTILQICYVSFLSLQLARYIPQQALFYSGIEYILLIATLSLSIGSAIEYSYAFFKSMKKKEVPRAH